jgi:hypothetical protein
MELVDFYNLSKFDKDPDRKKILQMKERWFRKFLIKLDQPFQNQIFILYMVIMKIDTKVFMGKSEIAKLSELDITNLFKFSDYK